MCDDSKPDNVTDINKGKKESSPTRKPDPSRTKTDPYKHAKSVQSPNHVSWGPFEAVLRFLWAMSLLAMLCAIIGGGVGIAWFCFKWIVRGF